MDTYKVGEAPWETNTESYPVGQAPWEVSQTQAEPSITEGGEAYDKKGLFDFLTQGPNLGERTAEQYKQATSKIGESMAKAKEGTFKGLAQAGIGSAQGILQAIYAPLTALTQKGFEATGIDPAKAIQSVAEPLGGKLQSWVESNPKAANALENIFKGLQVGAELTGGVAGLEGMKIPISAKEGFNVYKGALSDAYGGAKSTASYLKSKVPFTGGAKTAEEILATPEAKVPSLPLREQQFFYKEKARIVSETAKKSEALAKQMGEQSVAQAKQQMNNFNKQIGEVSREKAITLKKPAQKLMKDMSSEYVALTGEAAEGSPALSKTITHENLGSKIDSKFEYNPELGSSLKNDLGLIERPTKPQIDPTTKLPVIQIQVPVKTFTNQDILNKARELYQKVSQSTRKGNTVYSEAEHQVMQKYSFLMDTLGENGVNMTAANKFWKEWVPTRNRIVTEIKPFEETNISKMPIQSTINKASAGATTPSQTVSKLDAQNFISELEGRMKLPKGSIGEDTRKLFEGIEKAKLKKIDVEKLTKGVQEQIKIDKAETIRKVGIEKYNAESSALRKARIKKAIGIVLLGLGFKEFSKYIPNIF